MFDAHVHTSPCVFPRLATDLEVASMYADAGFSGCVLKGHAAPTVARAAAVSRTTGLEIYGGVVLNRSVGGVEPAVVQSTLAEGGRVIWMPTLDSANHRAAGLPLPPGPTPAPISMPPESNEALDAATEILRLVADADAVLATGHISASECAWLIQAAREHGVRRVLLTHATFSVPALTVAHVCELVELGAVCEITAYQLAHGSSAEALARLASSLGPEHCILTSDAGQPDSLRPPDALAWLVDRLVAAGLDPGMATAMASERPQTLIRP